MRLLLRCNTTTTTTPLYFLSFIIMIFSVPFKRDSVHWPGNSEGFDQNVIFEDFYKYYSSSSSKKRICRQTCLFFFLSLNNQFCGDEFNSLLSLCRFLIEMLQQNISLPMLLLCRIFIFILHITLVVGDHVIVRLMECPQLNRFEYKYLIISDVVFIHSVFNLPSGSIFKIIFLILEPNN